ncbi:hypothetical protein N3K66_008434 [Trichothecium roseum]|uniref:Uncharacterized protein n=1 Tax=Trichothecium roseum TaxID=47278 RepID=A0ACC0URW8_9HYPO|nr:hypothetical protein N3K66_008434 [Trichothecium roseum]
MPFHRLPRLPKAKRSEALVIAGAGAAVLAPLYMAMPGADERLASQTTKWAPSWERNINFFTPPVERGVQRIEPPISRMVQNVEQKLPLEKMAKGVDAGIKKGIDRWGPNSGSPPPAE